MSHRLPRGAAVDFGSPAQLQIHLESTAIEINSQIDELKGYLDLMTASWPADKAALFQGLQRECDASVVAVCAVLRRIAAVIDARVDTHHPPPLTP